MPKFVIERNLPGLGKLTGAERQGIAQKSCSILRQMGPEIQWVHSYCTDDKMFCIYIAPNAETIREHARRGGFPADAVLKVGAIVDPTTAE
jgi:predicted Rdx family selenoprotein